MQPKPYLIPLINWQQIATHFRILRLGPPLSPSPPELGRLATGSGARVLGAAAALLGLVVGVTLAGVGFDHGLQNGSGGGRRGGGAGFGRCAGAGVKSLTLEKGVTLGLEEKGNRNFSLTFAVY